METSAVEFDVGMVAGDGDISDADLAFMTTAKLDACLWNILNHHNTFTLFACSFKNHIVILWFFNGEHLDCLSIISLNGNWKFSLTNFTLEFLEIIMQGSSYDFLLHFDADPLKEAINMHSSA